MTDLDNVIPIGRATLSRARVISSDQPADGFEELAREQVGTRTFVAERGRARGKNVWRIRVDGIDEVIDYFEPDIHRETFAALVGTEPATLEEWLTTPCRIGSACTDLRNRNRDMVPTQANP